MTIDKQLRDSISLGLSELYDIQSNSEDLTLQPTRKEFQGTHTFVTFPVAKKAGKNPQVIAEELGNYLTKNDPLTASFQVVKGFLNLSLHDNLWLEKLADIAGEPDWGQTPANQSMAVVEISSPNTNKPLHLGHLRNNFLGFSVCNILEAAGYTVKKVCIVNDRGIHICKSMVAYEKFGNGDTPEKLKVKGDHFVGDYYVKFNQEFKQQVREIVASGADQKEAEKNAPILKDAQQMLKNWEAHDPPTLELWQLMNQWVYDGFEITYKIIGANFDQIYYESDTYLLGKDIVNEGLEKGVFYKKEDQSVWVDLSQEGLDEKLILRGDGTSVYITQDLGTADLRYQDFQFDRLVYVVGNEQDYHFNVLFKILKKLGRAYADGMYHLSYGMVDLPSGKMKSREGTVVDADQIIEEMVRTAEVHTRELGKIEGLDQEEAQKLYQTLGLGALKYFLTKVDPRKRILFNPEESISFQGDTGPFIQYTHARISAILRKARTLALPFDFDAAAISELHPTERSVIYLLNEYPNRIAIAASEFAPSVIAQYVYELAKDYNRFYADVSIFNEQDTNKQQFRVVLSAQTARIIKDSMRLLGIDVPERM
ncbi:MAG: arginine--tRNA ligase [Cyclobacteriaceae bacterium]|nr:MAG: arginine--tRNA ligase [Cyclobacteriaceae bacterium]